MQVKDYDNYNQLFQNKLSHYLGTWLSSYIYLAFEEYEGHTVVKIDVEPVPKPVYLKENGSATFYIRADTTTKSLDVEAANTYISMHRES